MSSAARIALVIIMLAAVPTGLLTVSAAAPRKFFLFDTRYLRKLELNDPSRAAEMWDTMQLLASVQGLANRDAPRLYLLSCSEFGVETDQFWLDWLRGEDGWLKPAEMVTLTSPEQVVQVFRPYIKGLAVYDPEVAATSCAAVTAAGCDGLVPVRFSRATNSTFALLTRQLGLPVRLWLVNQDGTS